MPMGPGAAKWPVPNANGPKATQHANLRHHAMPCTQPPQLVGPSPLLHSHPSPLPQTSSARPTAPPPTHQARYAGLLEGVQREGVLLGARPGVEGLVQGAW